MLLVQLHSRSDKEVKTKWQNLQTKAKKEYAESKKHRAQTGGGPAPKALTNETEHIVEMMKDCSSFVGLKGSESSIVIVTPEGNPFMPLKVYEMKWYLNKTLMPTLIMFMNDAIRALRRLHDVLTEPKATFRFDEIMKSKLKVPRIWLGLRKLP